MYDLATLTADAAKRFPDAEFVLDRPLDVAPHLGTRLSYATMAELVERLAAELAARGVRAGDVVAVYKKQNADLLLAACALARVGAIPAMLSPSLPLPEATALLDRLGPAHVLSSHGKLDDREAIVAESVGQAVSAGWGTAFTPVPRVEPPAPEDTYLITHTSGTTGLSKLVPQARRGTQMPVTLQVVIARALRFRDPFAMAVSFVHARTFAAYAAALRLGIRVIMISDPSPENALPLLREYGPGAVETHPNMAMGWEAELRRDPSPFERVRVVLSTFDAIHPRTIKTLMNACGRRSPLYFQNYGQSETGPVTQKMYTLRSMHRIDDRCVGRNFPGMTKVRVVDENGRPVKRGQVGRIAIQSKGMGLDYLGEHDRYTGNFVDGWWLMGDYGYLDRTGQLIMEDRGNDRIPGVDSVLRVEDRIIDALPEVREALLLGDADEQFLVYIPYEGATVDPQRLREVAGLPADSPVRLLQMSWQDIPMTSTWKVRRHLLLAALKQRRDVLTDGH